MTGPAKPTEGDGKTLWNASAGVSSFADVQAPANLREVVDQVAVVAKREAEDRVRAYQTQVTLETLRSSTV